MSNDPNPYCSPQADDDADWLLKRTLSFGDAQTRVRAAAMIGVVAPLFEFVCFVVEGIQYEWWKGDMGGFFIVALIFGAAALVVLFLAGWFGLFPVIRFASFHVRSLAARRVPLARWQKATDEALWTLPYAAALAVATWLIYSFTSMASPGFGGWQLGVVFNVVGNSIGAWCYLTVLAAWFRVWRQSPRVE